MGIFGNRRMTIRLLHVIDHLAFGGGQISLKNIVENIDRENFETFICALRQESEQININVKLFNLDYGRYDPRTIFKLASLCKEHNIDIMHAQLSKSVISCLLASFFCKAKVVIHERGGISQREMFFSVYRFLLRFLHRRAAAIIANSEAIASELVHKAGVKRERIDVIYNPVDFKKFDPEKISCEQARKNLGLSEEDFVIGYVGRLHQVKGVDVLIEAVSALVKKSPRFCLVLAGNGPERKALEKLAEQLQIAKKVKFLGMCDNVPAVMAACDVGIMPSRQEAFGRVAVELMRMKVPIITSGAGGL